ncbi:MAG: hypothetical protein LUE18_06695 [Akkermansia sp.]|nr:hypothetical protein [Akkermansia sp.]
MERRGPLRQLNENTARAALSFNVHPLTLSYFLIAAEAVALLPLSEGQKNWNPQETQTLLIGLPLLLASSPAFFRSRRLVPGRFCFFSPFCDRTFPGNGYISGNVRDEAALLPTTPP